ncbi:hypothetical protein CEXT_264931 [Caerostris extrusa]|uniref:Uncharacterized protein n=1 Tax=Caerostris extrusa TaxID=172846 RepID=A0AAV4WVR8_CAEEX|nr:hypothetical protein CEXT_264931 [Caerostris extrusa]
MGTLFGRGNPGFQIAVEECLLFNGIVDGFLCTNPQTPGCLSKSLREVAVDEEIDPQDYIGISPPRGKDQTKSETQSKHLSRR